MSTYLFGFVLSIGGVCFVSNYRGVLLGTCCAHTVHTFTAANLHTTDGYVKNVIMMYLRPSICDKAVAGSESRGDHVGAGQSRRCLLEYGAVYFCAMQ